MKNIFKNLKSQTLKLNSEFEVLWDCHNNTKFKTTKKDIKDISKKADILLTEIILSLIEYRKLSESKEFMSIDDVQKNTEEFILLVKYGNSINKQLMEYDIETEWHLFKLKMGV